jgi:hypothetical protein
MGCLYYPRKQTSVSYAADCDVITCYGGATIYDKHLASTVHCVDDEIIDWLQRRERRRCDRVGMPWRNQIQGQAISALKSLRPQQGVDQVTKQAGSDEGSE